jgi:hypothetical protein
LDIKDLYDIYDGVEEVLMEIEIFLKNNTNNNQIIFHINTSNHSNKYQSPIRRIKID